MAVLTLAEYKKKKKEEEQNIHLSSPSSVMTLDEYHEKYDENKKSNKLSKLMLPEYEDKIKQGIASKEEKEFYLKNTTKKQEKNITAVNNKNFNKNTNDIFENNTYSINSDDSILLPKRKNINTYVKTIKQNNTDKNTSNESILGTLNNTLIQTGKGVVKGSENIMDAGLQIGSSEYNPVMQLTADDLTWKQKAKNIGINILALPASGIETSKTYGKKEEQNKFKTSTDYIVKNEKQKTMDDVLNKNYSVYEPKKNYSNYTVTKNLGKEIQQKLGYTESKDIKSKQEIEKDLVKTDATANAMDKLGYNKVLANGKTVQQTIDDASYVKSNNLGGEIFQSVGQMLPSMIIGGNTGGNAALGVMAVQSFGGGVEEAYNNGATREEATRYGVMNSAIETATEKMFAGVGGVFGKGALDDVVKTKIESNIRNEIARRLVDFGLDAVGEGTEEVIGDLLQPLAKKMTYMSEEDLTNLYKDEDYVSDFVSGVLTSAVLQGMTLKQKESNVKYDKDKTINTHSNEEKNYNTLEKNEQIENIENKQDLSINEELVNKEENVSKLPVKQENKPILPVNNNSNSLSNTTTTNLDEITTNLDKLNEEIQQRRESIKNEEEFAKLNKQVEEMKQNDNFAQDNKTIANEEVEQTSFSYDETAKRYDDLQKTNKIEYFKKDNGDVRITMYDSNNDVVNQLDVYSKENAEKQLGNKIGNYIYNNAEDTYKSINLNSLNNTKEQPQTEYMMAHRPTETKVYASDISKTDNLEDYTNGEFMPKDVYQHPEWYFNMNEDYSKESYKVLSKIKGNPDAEITIYRATPGIDINAGDWVTLSKKYAEYHNNSQFDGKGNIVEKVVKAKDVQFAGDDINEFGYFPSEIEKTSSENELNKTKIKKQIAPVKEEIKEKILLPVKDVQKQNKEIKNEISEIKDEIKELKDAILPIREDIEKISKVDYNLPRGDNYGKREYMASGEGISSNSEISMGGRNNNRTLLGVEEKSNGEIHQTTKREQFERFEREARESETKKLTKEQQELKNRIKRLYGKNIIFFDKQNELFDGGSSKSNLNEIFVYSKSPLRYQRLIVSHELMENSILNNKKLENEYLKQTREDIINDTGFEKTKQNMGLEDETDSMVAKEILSDYFASYETGIKLDYDIELSQETLDEMQYDSELVKQELEKNGKIAPVKEIKQIAPVKNTINADIEEDALEAKEKKRKWTKTSTESKGIKGNVLISDLDPQELYYFVQENKKTVDNANYEYDVKGGYEKSVDYVKSKIASKNDKVSLTDIALTERLIQEAAQKGDIETASDLIIDLSILGTDLGQKVQALSLIKRLTPEGQLRAMVRYVERSKAKMPKTWGNVEVTDDIKKDILGAYDKNGNFDQNDLNERVEKAKEKLAKQIKITAGDKVNEWRYLAMLGNPRTHIRNIVSNAAMKTTRAYSNTVARTLETILPVKSRTKTWKRPTSEVIDFTNKTAEELKDVISGDSKYSERADIESKKQVFKTKALQKVSDFNSNMLSKEDWIFSKSAFKSTLKEYLTANGIRTIEDIESNPKLIEKAKKYAVEQAEIATFRQYSKIASAINNFESKNGVTKFVTGAIIPFKKTPINIAKAGIKYSPVGLLKNVTIDTYNLVKGNIEASQWIDNFSQGLTGSSLAILGYALAKAGILKGAGSDDKEGKYDRALGEQSYSLNIGGKSYSLSWLSPTAIPLFVGTNMYETFEEKQDWDANVVIDSLAQTLDPMSSMSVLDGITSTLNSYKNGNGAIVDIAENTTQSYISQFIPTLLSQIASVTDDKKRSTKASKNSSFTFGEETLRKLAYKIPGARQQLEVSTDIWGNEQSQEENIFERAFDTFIAPYSKTKDKATDLDEELKRLFVATDDSKVLPNSSINSYISTNYNGESIKYEMSAGEYTNFKKTYGNTAYDYLDTLTNTKKYKNATDEEKAKMVEEIYDLSRAKAQLQYYDDTNIKEYTVNSNQQKYKDLVKLKMSDRDIAEYVSTEKLSNTIRDNKTLTDSERKSQIGDLISNTKLNNNQMAYLYSKYYSSEKTLNKIVKSGIPVKEYIKFNSQEFKSDKNSKGDSIPKSKQYKIINYINSLNLSVVQKALLIKSEYKNYSNYDKQIINYINSQPITKQQKIEILTELGFTIKNGVVY